MRARGARRAGMAALLAAMVAAQGGALAADEPVVTKAFNVTGDDLAPTRTYSAPAMAVDPNNSMNIVASTPEFRSKTCKLMRSSDGGRTWRILDQSPNLESYPFCFHTSGTQYQTNVAFGRNGTLYYALTGYDNNDLGAADPHGGVYGNLSVLLARSTNLGESWETTLVRNSRGKVGAEGENNRPVTGLAVDTKSGNDDIVYVGWQKNAPAGVTPAPVGHAMMAVSTDGGRSFGEPVKLAGEYFKDKPDPNAYGGGAPQLAVDNEGTLHAAFFGRTTVQGGPPVNAILVSSTRDRGKTFTVTEAAPPSPYYLPLIMTWNPEGGRRGSLHLVYEDKIGAEAGLSDRDIFHKRSTDGGRTWTAPKMINDDNPNNLPGTGSHLQVNPNITVAPNGRLDAAWWDFRDDTGGFTNDVYYAFSEDNGATWSKNYRITDRSIDRRVGVWSNGYDMRTPVGIASTNELAVVAYDDTRNTLKVGEGQDIFSAVVQHEVLGSGANDAARYVLAALVGLAAVGLILLAVSFAAGRRTRSEEPRPAPRDDRTPAPADADRKVGTS
ncbi:MAG: glycoside hydrolase [Actinobacteria bacterium]|nr:glycoside hydrolase [Actinomycetota bacterium]